MLPLGVVPELHPVKGWRRSEEEGGGMAGKVGRGGGVEVKCEDEESYDRGKCERR